MPKNLILFGAGASFGAGSSFFGLGNNPKEKLPPLGNNLFNELQQFDPNGWGKLDNALATKFNTDFEKGMQKLAEINPYEMPPLQRAMAAYFFNFHPGKSNLYVQLSNKIKRSQWDGAIATLNYERLLEISLVHFNLKPVYGKIPNEPKEIELCFPHGCCHIFCDSVIANGNVSIGNGMISLGAGGQISLRSDGNINFSQKGTTTSGSKIKFIRDPAEHQKRINQDSIPPIMSYFAPEKNTTSGTNFISNQRSRYLQLVSAASNIAIIGMRVRPHDAHIWDSLKTTKAKLIYCSGKSGAEEFNSWKSVHRSKANDIVMPTYFRESFQDLCEHLEIQ